MSFSNMFSNNGLTGDALKAALGLTSSGTVSRSDDRDDDRMVFVSAAAYRRATGFDIRDVLAGLATGGGTASPSPSPSPTPSPAPTAPPGAVIVNPLLDLDLAPVRPGDLITAASYNALIAAVAALHIRLSLMEAKGGPAPPAPTPTPTPPVTATPTPPATRLPPDLRAAYVVNHNRSTNQLATIMATGLRLNTITDARLIHTDQQGKRLGTTSLPNRRTTATSAVFAVGKIPANMARAATVTLEVSGPDGKDTQPVERPTSTTRLRFEDKLRMVDDPLDLIDGLDADFKALGIHVGTSIAGNLR